MGASNLVAFFIILTTAATLHAHGVHMALTPESKIASVTSCEFHTSMGMQPASRDTLRIEGDATCKT